jgi:hypothetical protein
MVLMRPTWTKELAMKFVKALRLTLILAALAATYPSSALAQVSRERARNPNKRVGGDIKSEASKQAHLPFISDVRVIPSASNAVISFKSSQRTPPLVEIGRVPPVPDRYGVMTFPLGTSIFTNFVQPQDGRYTLNVNVANEQLEAGTTYYYIINVFNDNRNDPKRKREQEVGEFITLSQTVKVVWERVLLIDADDDGDSMAFWFWINHGQPGARSLIMSSASRGKLLRQLFGMYHEYVIENAPNDLSLSISAAHDIRSIARGTGISEPLSGPSRDHYSEYNVARETIDLTRYPSEVGETRSYPFKLVSMPNGGNLGNLSFEVYCRFEITRRAK